MPAVKAETNLADRVSELDDTLKRQASEHAELKRAVLSAVEGQDLLASMVQRLLDEQASQRKLLEAVLQSNAAPLSLPAVDEV